MPAPSGYEIDVARAHELVELPRIEDEAARIFPREDLQNATGGGMPASFFVDAAADGRLWVARVLATAEVVGFAATILVDGEGHLQEMDVLPAHGRRGIGRALVDRVAQWGRERGLRRITLTTFRHLRWNAPFYASAGFVEVEPARIGPQLRAIVEAEVRNGLDPGKRVAMALDLATRPVD